MLTVTESGLDHLPVEPRSKTFASHEPGCDGLYDFLPRPRIFATSSHVRRAF
jgi:hypothetical protein